MTVTTDDPLFVVGERIMRAGFPCNVAGIAVFNRMTSKSPVYRWRIVEMYEDAQRMTCLEGEMTGLFKHDNGDGGFAPDFRDEATYAVLVVHCMKHDIAIPLGCSTLMQFLEAVADAMEGDHQGGGR